VAWRRKAFLLVLLAVLGGGSAWAQESTALRLGFVLNFARFAEWPETILKPGAPLRICFAPGDANMVAQSGDLSRQSIQGRTLQVKSVARPADTSGCHVLYVPTELPGALPPWLDAAMRAGALTVGDMPDFIDAGGMIGLVPVGGRYRFDVNLGVARQAELRLSSQLLKLARTVK
jgi:hypothetical protein